MTAIATIGERALRRLGVAIVPVASRPANAATVTQDTIATNALIELGVIASDETPAASDRALALSKVAAVVSSLNSQGFVSWTNIPASVAEEYTRLTASLLATSFGKTSDPALYGALEKRVRLMATILTAPELAEDVVQQIHDGLVATGKARWSVFDVPPPAELPYELLAAASLASTFEKPADPSWIPQASKLLAQIVALASSGQSVSAVYF